MVSWGYEGLCRVVSGCVGLRRVTSGYARRQPLTTRRNPSQPVATPRNLSQPLATCRNLSNADPLAIGGGFDPERRLIHRPDVRLLVHRHDDNAAFADSVAPAILLGVVPDDRAPRDEHVAIDDRVPDPRVPPDPHAR